MLDSADHDGGQGLNSQMAFTAPTTGTYYVQVGGLGSGIGTYEVQVDAIPGDTTAPRLTGFSPADGENVVMTSNLSFTPTRTA